MTLTPRETLNRQMKKLNDDLLFLGSMVIHATIDAVAALNKRDLAKARRTYDGDTKINSKRYEIENNVMVLIATQQPMGRDVRFLASAFEVANELERMGDYAKGIARICIMMADHPPLHHRVEIPQMSESTTNMLQRALDAFSTGDIEAARSIPKEDDLIDSLYNEVFRGLITKMVTDPTAINQANYLMWAAHNLERMADRVTNICERTVYVVTGRFEEIKSSDDEQQDQALSDVSNNPQSHDGKM
jgi:phosphate transport system protein